MRAWWIRLLIRSGQPQLPQIQIVALLWSHFASSWDMYVSHRDWDSLQALAPLPFWCWLTESNRRHPTYKAGALPTELNQQIAHFTDRLFKPLGLQFNAYPAPPEQSSLL